jgi:hypothetical protein
MIYVALIIGTAFGFGVGILINNYGILALQHEVRVGELANFIVAIILGFTLPLSINKWIGDKRKLKDITIERASSYLAYLDGIETMFLSWIPLKEIDQNNTRDMTVRLRLLRNKTAGLISEINMLNTKIENTHTTELTNHVNDYWRIITAGDVMNSGFKLTSDFISNEQTERQKIMNKVMEIIAILNRS